MTEAIYSKHSIDPNKLLRDYLTNSLKRGEKPNKKDLEYLYIELNLSRRILCSAFNWSNTNFVRWTNKYNISKSIAQRYQNITNTKLERYNDIKYNNIDRMKETKLERYGYVFYTNKQQIAATWSHKTESELNERLRKSQSTCLERYGVSSYTNQSKKKKTCLAKYGVECYPQTDEFKKDIKSACLTKYGVEHYAKTNEFKSLFKNKEWVEEIEHKKYLTKKKNNSFNRSKPEDNCYELLCKQYGNDNVIRQYKSKLYPFNCDFYIKSTDTYIEYNGYWSHGKEPYNPNNREHQLIVEKWKSKNWNYAIKYWTERDPLKREIAKNNNLNYIEIF